MTIINSSTASGVLSSRGILRTLFLLSLFIFAPNLASAATYYVAPSGSNSKPGTQAQPFATLKKAHDVAVAGDTIFMRGGTYKFPAQTTFTRDGTSGNPIKVFNFTGEIPVIDGINLPAGDVVIRSTSANWHIKGLEVKNGAYFGIYIAGDNNTIENNNIHHNGRLGSKGGAGIHVGQTASGTLILNNDLHHNRDTNNNDADGIAIKHNLNSGNVVRGNRMWRNSDDGIDLWNTKGITLENNWAWENGYDDNLNPLGNGTGFKLGGSGAGDGGHTLKNNVSWGNKATGFNDNNADLPITLYNNTSWEDGGKNFLILRKAHVMRNNLSVGPRGVNIDAVVNDTFNSWNLAVTENNADFSSLDFTCARGPRQADGSLPNCSFLHLATGSDLIDKGTNVGIPYNGSAPDLGAFEYSGTRTGSTPQIPLNVSTATSDGRFAYKVAGSFGTPADNSANQTTIASTTAPTANFSASPTSGTAPLTVTTVSSRPVAAYNFEEVSGSKVIDASGQGNHGTRSGTSRITQGRFGKALSFDGLNDWVTVNGAASLDLTTGMTVEAWVYPTESMTGWRTLVTKESPPDRASYYLHANSDTDQPATGVFIGDNQDVRGGPWLWPNTWVHLASTYDGTTQRLYVNGSEVANRAQSEPIEVSGGVLRIGGNSIWGELFKGRIDEIRVYDQALSAAEITTDMNTSVATSSPPVFLVGDKNVTPVTDSIPQGKAQAFQTQAAVTGWVTGLSVYVDTGSTATTLVAGLYTDENDHPGTLLAQGTLSSPESGGWKMVSLPPVSITAGSKYWVAILSPSGMLTFRDSGTWVGGLSETSSQSMLSELPSTWTTGTYELEGPLSAYGAGYQ